MFARSRHDGRRHRREAASLGLAAVVAVAGVGVAGCRGPIKWPPPRSTTTTTSATVNEVSFTLTDDYKVILTSGQIKPGVNHVTATNTGAHDHELIFVAARDHTVLPTKANGSVDESKLAPGTDLGEIHLPAGATGNRNFTFRAGPYVGFCNHVGGPNGEYVHFKEGQYLDFTVR